MSGRASSWTRFAARAPVAVLAGKAALAAGLAWFVTADVLGNRVPVFAPLAALLTVQGTVWESVSRGVQRVAGVIVGVFVALAFARVAGIHAWSIALLIFVALLVGRALRLGVQGAIQVPVSALLVLAVGATRGGWGMERIVDTAIGAAIGVLVGAFVVPTTYVETAAGEVRDLASRLAELLRDIARELASRGDDDEVETAARHLREARRVADEAATVKAAVGEARESLRLNPVARRDRDTAQHLGGAVDMLGLVEIQVRGIARTVADAAQPGASGWPLPQPVATALADLLTVVAGGVDAWAASDEGTVPSGDALHRCYDAALAAIGTSGLDARAAATATAIAVDAHRIIHELPADRVRG